MDLIYSFKKYLYANYSSLDSERVNKEKTIKFFLLVLWFRSLPCNQPTKILSVTDCNWRAFIHSNCNSTWATSSLIYRTIPPLVSGLHRQSRTQHISSLSVWLFFVLRNVSVSFPIVQFRCNILIQGGQFLSCVFNMVLVILYLFGRKFVC